MLYNQRRHRDRPISYQDDQVYLTVMDNNSPDGVYADPHQPPFQRSDSRLLYRSSTSKQTKQDVYSGGGQRRETLWQDNALDKYTSYSEGGSWRGRVGGREIAVSWSYLESSGWYKNYDYLIAAEAEYVIYIGGKFGNLTKINQILSDPAQHRRGMSIAGVCLIDPAKTNTNYKYVIQVLYKSNNVFKSPLVCRFGVTLNNQDRLEFTPISQLTLSALNPDNKSDYYPALTGFSSDGLHFYWSDIVTMSRYPDTMGNNYVVRIAENLSGYQLIRVDIMEPLLDEQYYQPVLQRNVKKWRLIGSLIKSDYDRFVHYYHLDDQEHVNENKCGAVVFRCIEIMPDGTFKRINHVLGDPEEILSPFDQNQLIFASTRLRIYQYYRGYPDNPDMNDYTSTLITVIDGEIYYDNIVISQLWTSYLNGLTGYLPVIEYPNWANAAYTDKLLILGTFEPYVKTPTFLIDYAYSATNGVTIKNVTKIVNDADKIDSVYPSDLNGAAIVSPISLIHLPY